MQTMELSGTPRWCGVQMGESYQGEFRYEADGESQVHNFDGCTYDTEGCPFLLAAVCPLYEAAPWGFQLREGA